MTYERPSKAFTCYRRPAIDQLLACSPLGNDSKRANQVFERYLHIITAFDLDIPEGYIERLRSIWQTRLITPVEVINLELTLVDPSTLKVKEVNEDLAEYIKGLDILQRYLLIEQTEWIVAPEMATAAAREKRVTMAQDSRAKNLTLDDLREHYSAHFTEEPVSGGVKVLFADSSQRKFKVV